VKGAREAWFERQLDFDPEKLVFIDETGATTKMARLYGRAPRGERCRAAVPHGHWKTTTLTAGLRIGPPRREQSQTSGTHSRTLSMLSHLMNAETTSPPQAMTHSDRKLL
jgi:hypothetical protein